MEDAEKAKQISLEEFLEVEVCYHIFLERTRTYSRLPCQRHKLGSNLTPVTPESFAKWKRTRMDKKTAEEEALKKAKDDRHAAGKNSGMSGRDLVRAAINQSCCQPHRFFGSLLTTQNGSKTKKRRRKKSGILRSIGKRRRTRISPQKRIAFGTYSWERVRTQKLVRTTPMVVLSIERRMIRSRTMYENTGMYHYYPPYPMLHPCEYTNTSIILVTSVVS